MVDLLLLLCVGGIACLTPVTLYLAWASAVNRRPRPTVVPGAWDFVAVLAGLSGFVIVGGGVLVAGLQSNVRVLFRGNNEARAAVADDRAAWAATAGGYLILVGAAAGAGVLARSRSLAVYNVDRDRAEAAVTAALIARDVFTSRSGDLWVEGGNAVVELQTFDPFRHATVWLLTDDKRKAQEIEAALRKQFAAHSGSENPVAAWLTSAVACLTFAVLGFVLLLGYVGYFRFR